MKIMPKHVEFKQNGVAQQNIENYIFECVDTADLRYILYHVVMEGGERASNLQAHCAVPEVVAGQGGGLQEGLHTSVPKDGQQWDPHAALGSREARRQLLRQVQQLVCLAPRLHTHEHGPHAGRRRRRRRSGGRCLRMTGMSGSRVKP